MPKYGFYSRAARFGASENLFFLGKIKNINLGNKFVSETGHHGRAPAQDDVRVQRLAQVHVAFLKFTHF